MKYTAASIKHSGASVDLQNTILSDLDMIYIECKGEVGMGLDDHS